MEPGGYVLGEVFVFEGGEVGFGGGELQLLVEAGDAHAGCAGANTEAFADSKYIDPALSLCVPFILSVVAPALG